MYITEQFYTSVYGVNVFTFILPRVRLLTH